MGNYYRECIKFRLFAHQKNVFEIQHSGHEFLNHIPKHLYKYRKSGEKGMIDFYVGKQMIYSCKLSGFGDKFEGITRNVLDKIKAVDTAQEFFDLYKPFLFNYFKKKFIMLDDEIVNAIIAAFESEQYDEKKIYKIALPVLNKQEKPQIKRFISAICYFLNSLENHCDDESGFNKGIRGLIDTNEEFGAYCLCDSCDNDALWDLYSDDFKGYCIEYDISNPTKSKGSIRFVCDLFPVKYENNKNDDWMEALLAMTLENIDNNGQADELQANIDFNVWIIETICTKKTQWSWQNEWRFLGKGNKSYKAPLISSIIVGYRISNEDFEKIKYYADKKFIPLKITSFDFSTKKVLIRDITDDDIKKIKKNKEQ